MLPYNGFSPSQRAEGGRLQTLAFKSGAATPPKVCRACGNTQGVIAHLEDYSRPLEAIIGLCAACHRAVHVRFGAPAQFERRRMCIMAGALPHMHGVVPDHDLLLDIQRGLYLPTREAVLSAPTYRGRFPDYWTKPYVPAAQRTR